MEKQITNNMLAPCGMNCAICASVLDKKSKPCPGCRNGNKGKPDGCIHCVIANCNDLKETASGFCYDCKRFPCKRMQTLNARYEKNYSMSMFENLANIQTLGLDSFVATENERWVCPTCGELLCVHRKFCLSCKYPR